ncbi:MAG: hypothetical protein C7B45_01440 [Sulfobacillus acidophilus]|uniref:Uncharacterized protein n=1 Tax=Sulfobacillus acidophilus TaxID=53633 RepID=A0A2T2WP13_9FIRM|nr:MAG: hypothetical protein C7B45_01440 [Sulfobacillus acidophilus]
MVDARQHQPIVVVVGFVGLGIQILVGTEYWHTQRRNPTTFRTGQKGILWIRVEEKTIIA